MLLTKTNQSTKAPSLPAIAFWKSMEFSWRSTKFHALHRTRSMLWNPFSSKLKFPRKNSNNTWPKVLMTRLINSIRFGPGLTKIPSILPTSKTVTHARLWATLAWPSLRGESERREARRRTHWMLLEKNCCKSRCSTKTTKNRSLLRSTYNRRTSAPTPTRSSTRRSL